MGKRIGTILLFTIGLSIFLYPIISNYFNNIVHYKVIEEYRTNVENLSVDAKNKQKKDAEAYNQSLIQEVKPIEDPFENIEEQNKIFDYPSILNVGQAMGYIEIPKIKSELPIYAGVSETVLSKGIGHMPNSSLPIGGTGTHSVLTGHRGLADSKLFRHLDQLEVGDTFFIHTLDEVLAYEVDQIIIVLPHETDALRIDHMKDLVTLITCEPYMVNSHRMLVRGKRIPYNEEYVNKQMDQDPEHIQTSPFIWWGLGIILTIFISFIIYIVARKKKNKGVE